MSRTPNPGHTPRAPDTAGTSSEVVVETDRRVRVVTLDRPQARNALSISLATELFAVLAAADDDTGVGAIVVTGADPAFCAGVDLKEAARDGATFFARLRQADCISLIGSMRKPVIGAINGAAFTGGLELALGCDFLVASQRAVFADTHARVGVLPSGGMTARLPLAVGTAMARRMSFTGEIVGAQAAHRIGLVTEVVPHGELLSRARRLASLAASAPAPAMLALKRLYAGAAATTVQPARDAEYRESAAHVTDWTGLEQRRLAVMRHNRAQLGKTGQ